MSILPHDLPKHSGFEGCLSHIEIKTASSQTSKFYPPGPPSGPAKGRSVVQQDYNVCASNPCRQKGICLPHGPSFTYGIIILHLSVTNLNLKFLGCSGVSALRAGLGLCALSQGIPVILKETCVPREVLAFRCMWATSATVLLERLAGFAIQVIAICYK